MKALLLFSALASLASFPALAADELPGAGIARSGDFCQDAAESFAEIKAGVNDDSDVQCSVLDPTEKVGPDEYAVHLLCGTSHGGASVRLSYLVRTKLDSFRSPKTGKIYSSCSGVSAQPERN